MQYNHANKLYTGNLIQTMYISNYKIMTSKYVNPYVYIYMYWYVTIQSLQHQNQSELYKANRTISQFAKLCTGNLQLACNGQEN